jgi:hypothetical protein
MAQDYSPSPVYDKHLFARFGERDARDIIRRNHPENFEL